MGPDSVFAAPERSSDALVAEPGIEEHEDFAFSMGESFPGATCLNADKEVKVFGDLLEHDLQLGARHALDDESRIQMSGALADQRVEPTASFLKPNFVLRPPISLCVPDTHVLAPSSAFPHPPSPNRRPASFVGRPGRHKKKKRQKKRPAIVRVFERALWAVLSVGSRTSCLVNHPFGLARLDYPERVMFKPLQTCFHAQVPELRGLAAGVGG